MGMQHALEWLKKRFPENEFFLTKDGGCIKEWMSDDWVVADNDIQLHLRKIGDIGATIDDRIALLKELQKEGIDEE